MAGIKSADHFIWVSRAREGELNKLHTKAAEINGTMKNSRLPRGWGLNVRRYCLVNEKVLQKSIQIKVDAKVLKLGGNSISSINDEVKVLLEKLMLGIDPAKKCEPGSVFLFVGNSPWLQKNKLLSKWNWDRPLMPSGANGGITSHNTPSGLYLPTACHYFCVIVSPSSSCPRIYRSRSPLAFAGQLRLANQLALMQSAVSTATIRHGVVLSSFSALVRGIHSMLYSCSLHGPHFLACIDRCGEGA